MVRTIRTTLSHGRAQGRQELTNARAASETTKRPGGSVLHLLAGVCQRADEGWTRAELETHLHEEQSTFNWLLEPMLEQAGLAIEHAGYDSRRVFAEYVCRVPA